MKQFTTLLLVFFSITLSYAQDQMQTKEEILQYIKNEISEIKAHSSEGESMGLKYNIENDYTYTNSNIELKNCILKYQRQRDRKIYYSDGTKSLDGKPKQYTIDLSRTEPIRFQTGYDKFVEKDKAGKVLSEKKDLVFLFQEKKDDGTYESSWITVAVIDSDFKDYESLEIYKAFQQLRKLCNAPEPSY